MQGPGEKLLPRPLLYKPKEVAASGDEKHPGGGTEPRRLDI